MPSNRKERARNMASMRNCQRQIQCELVQQQLHRLSTAVQQKKSASKALDPITLHELAHRNLRAKQQAAQRLKKEKFGVEQEAPARETCRAKSSYDDFFDMFKWSDYNASDDEDKQNLDQEETRIGKFTVRRESVDSIAETVVASNSSTTPAA